MKKKPLILKTVTVRIIELEWVKNNMRDLYLYLGQIEDEKLFQNELVKVLLKKQDYSNHILLWFFTPYLIYIISTLVYFSVFFTQTRDSVDRKYVYADNGAVVLRIIIAITTLQ